jgi:hypothetical protein
MGGDHCLLPGTWRAILYAEFHPVVWMFDDDFTHIKYHYDNRELIVTENQGTYTGQGRGYKRKGIQLEPQYQRSAECIDQSRAEDRIIQ